MSVDLVALVTALKALPTQQREAVVLHHMAGVPIDQIAAQLGAPVGTVKSWLSRGRVALARRLGEPGTTVTNTTEEVRTTNAWAA
jgi:RNA polymerase sigma-70 factor (ECF subfamily)